MPSSKYHIHKFTEDCLGAKVFMPNYAKGCTCDHCAQKIRANGQTGIRMANEIRAEEEGRPDPEKVNRAVDGRLDGVFLSPLEKRMAILELRRRRGWGAVRIGQWLGVSDRTVERHFAVLREQGLM